jgi:assimilatory nitrate reductase catalytic subunit
VEIHPQAAARLGIKNDDWVRVRTPRASMELKALVVPSIRPDTLFIPFHYGHREAVNQLTNPAVEPTVKIPEYKVSAATVERVDQPERAHAKPPLAHFTAENAPRMFPYAVGETKDQATREAKHF